LKIAVLGAGALGCAMGSCLSEAGHEVWLINRRTDHVDAMNAYGLTIRVDGVDRKISVKAARNAHEISAQADAVDLIIVLVKSFHTYAAIVSATPIVGPKTLVLSLQNGLGHEDVLAEVVGREKVVAGKTYRVSIDVISTTNTSYFRVGSGGEGSETYLTVNGIGTGTTTRTFTVPAGVTSVFINVGVTISGTIVFDNVSLKEDVADRSVQGNGLQVFGTVTKTAVATGAELMGYSGFSTTGSKVNYLRMPYASVLDFDTSFCFMGWIKIDGAVGTQDQHFFDMINDNNGNRVNVFYQHSTTNFYIAPGNGGSNVGSAAVQFGHWYHVVALANTVTTDIYVNGELSGTGAGGFNHTWPNGSVTLGTRFAEYNSNAYGLNGSMALIRLSKSTPSPEQIKKIYNDEKFLFQENAKATLYGSSDAVTALAYDDDTELLHVGTSAGRSVFQGLRRIDNTTDAVGVAISASNGMVAED